MLKRDLPPSPVEAPCKAVGANDAGPTGVGEDAAERAREMLDDASRITLLGELSRAQAVLIEARDLNPSSPEVHFELARVNAALGDTEGAVKAFCQVVAIDPSGADGREAAARVDRLARSLPDPIPPEARSAFQNGLTRFDAGDPDGAAQAFGQALANLPDWAEARYNRGVARLEAGNEEGGRSDLTAFLALRPDTPDRGDIAALLENSPPRPQYDPAVALAAGALIPGGGQLYAGKHREGAAYLLAAAASIGFGALHVRTHIVCRSLPGDDGCPPDDILEQSSGRPLLTPGLAVGVAIAWIGAVRAYQHASGGATGLDDAAASTVGGVPVRIGAVVEPARFGLHATFSVGF